MVDLFVDEITRFQLCFFTSVIAGCSYTGTQPVGEDRELQLRSPSVQEVESGWLLKVKVFNQDNTMGDTYFHDVRVSGYTKEGKLVGSKSPGKLNNQIDIEIMCSGFPHFITVKARESPCDDHIKHMNLIYGGMDDEGDRFWREQYRECGEEFPSKS